jgi:transposase-like protein
MKYTAKYKYECVQKYLKGEHIEHLNGQSRNSFMSHVRDWVKRYNDLGYDGLSHQAENKVWSKEERFDLVAKVLAGNSIKGTARAAYINPGQLYQWVKKYQEKGIHGLECRKGRKPKELTMSPKRKNKTSPTEEEELKLLRERNEYLEIENEYLKKLDALVAKREAKQHKAKKQK